MIPTWQTRAGVRRLPLLVAVVAVAAAVSGALGARADVEQPLAPDDFAFGRAVEIEQTGPIQTLLLDLEVYRGSVEPGLADLRVMNAAGEAVPHAVRRLSEPTAREAEPAALPLFELHPPSAADPSMPEPSSAAPGGAFPYRIRAEVSESGALVEIDSRPARSGEAPADAPLPIGYLLDASQLDAPVECLELELAEGEAGFMVPVVVEGSDDLARFTPVAGPAVVARLEEGGHRIEQRELRLGATSRRYLRLLWPSGPLPVRISAVRARLVPDVEAPPRERTEIFGEPIADDPGAYVFDLGGRLPVDRVQVRLPGMNALVQARLYSAAERDGPWQRHFDGLLYELEYPAETLRNPEIVWPVTRHRWVKLEGLPADASAAGRPTLEARWHPEQLLFVTRGAPPYQLVHGRHGAPPAAFDPAEILAAWPTGAAPPPRETAHLGPELALGDRSLLAPPPPPRPYRTWLLWAVLIVVVGVVLALSGSLLREMRSADGD